MRRVNSTLRVHVRRRYFRRLSLVGSALIVGLGLASAPLSAIAADAPVDLGTATSFEVLAGSTVTNTGPTSIIGGDVGVSPGTAVTGFPPGKITNGTQPHKADGVANTAKSDLVTAYNDAAGRPCPPDHNFTDKDLGGMTLQPGVYCFSKAAGLTGVLTLDTQGNPDAVFIFQVGSALITASNSTVKFLNGASNCGVFWQVGTQATLGTTTSFIGTIMALATVVLNTSATIIPGRALARNAAVTLDNNVITRPDCRTTTSQPSSSSNPSASGTPVTLTTTVKPAMRGVGTPTGRVTFKAASNTVGVAPVDSSSGQATVTTSGLPPGNNTITAVYSGTPGLASSESPPLVQTVTPGPTVTSQPGAGGTGGGGPGGGPGGTGVGLPNTGHPPGP